MGGRNAAGNADVAAASWRAKSVDVPGVALPHLLVRLMRWGGRWRWLRAPPVIERVWIGRARCGVCRACMRCCRTWCLREGSTKQRGAGRYVVTATLSARDHPHGSTNSRHSAQGAAPVTITRFASHAPTTRLTRLIGRVLGLALVLALGLPPAAPGAAQSTNGQATTSASGGPPAERSGGPAITLHAGAQRSTVRRQDAAVAERAGPRGVRLDVYGQAGPQRIVQFHSVRGHRRCPLAIRPGR